MYIYVEKMYIFINIVVNINIYVYLYYLYVCVLMCWNDMAYVMNMSHDFGRV